MKYLQSYLWVKRVFDLVFSITGFLILLPLFLIICVFLFVMNDKKVFFTQERPGYKEKIFKILKFKTMNDRKDAKGNLMPDKDRLTKIGQLLRKTSLDEIPQLLNVIKGEMSFIGPRPLLVRYLPYYTDQERIRHEVRPGITGLAQVSGRNFLEWNKRLSLDVAYVEGVSLRMDFSIILKTIHRVITSKDVATDVNGVMVDLDESRK